MPERVARFSLITTESFDDQMEEISADLKFGKRIECAKEELKTLEALKGYNELSREYDNGRIEDWKGDRAEQAEAKQRAAKAV
jgi:hypothetical protein